MRIIVTGGAGFIGANLCRRLLADQGVQVLALDDMSTGRRENLADVETEALDMVEGSILDLPMMRSAFEGADAVVHLAARPSVPRSLADPLRSHEVNATGTMNVLEACRAAGVGHVIVASSSSVYGGNPILPKVESLATRPLSPYAASKLATEAYALAYANSFDLDVLAFRFFNVFGPLQPAGHAYAAVVPALASAALEQRPLPVHGDGGQTRDFTYVADVADVIAAALRQRLASPDPVNLAFGSRRSILEVIASLERLLGRRLPVDHLPVRPGDVRHSQADNTALRGLFPGIEPRNFEDSLATTVAWLATQQSTT